MIAGGHLLVKARLDMDKWARRLHSMRKAYATDVSDEQWAKLEPLIPPAKKGGRPRKKTTNMREVVNAIFYLNRSGCQWRLLPHDFPPKSTVYYYFSRWRNDGTWDAINKP